MFQTPFFGLRAAGNDLKNKWLSGTSTIRKIVSVWAPAGGVSQSGAVYSNPTAAYIDFVGGKAGLSPDAQILHFDDYVNVVMAMITKENGQNPYAKSAVYDALKVGFKHGKSMPMQFKGL